tara:strand:- start:47 stop:661 length:615 start_codon:yes stop_codon:yes gene_type:complete
MSDDLDQLRKLAKEAIEIKKRIKVDTDKLQTVKNEFIERSKNRNSSYTIAVDDGSIRIIKYKRTIYYNLNQKGFDKLDNQTKNNLLKKKFVKIKFSVDTDNYKDALDNNTLPNNLKDLVENKERKPFSISVLLNREEEEANKKIEQRLVTDEDSEADDEALEDLYLNVFPPELVNFTDDDPEDLTDVQKQDLGVDSESVKDDDI